MLHSGRTCLAEADGVVAAVVAKFQLEGGGPQGLTNDLVTHADAENGLLAQQLLRVGHRIGSRRGVPLHSAYHVRLLSGAQKVSDPLLACLPGFMGYIIYLVFNDCETHHYPRVVRRGDLEASIESQAVACLTISCTSFCMPPPG